MIKVVASGLFTTLQDRGRFGYGRYGVPVSGPMDKVSASYANALLRNDENAAVIEFTASGPVLEFETGARIAITGALFSPMVDGEGVAMNAAFSVAKGSRLSFSKPNKGIRGYIAIAGGFRSHIVLGSTCYYKGITSVSKLKRGMSLDYDESIQKIPTEMGGVKSDWPLDFEKESLEVFKGPEFGLLDDSIQNRIQKTIFKITSNSNRMAYILENSQNFTATEIITAPVQPGTVQLTPSGRLHILMRDAQTTGGYARIFQLTERSIDLLAQKRAGDKLYFKIVDPPFDIPF